MATGAVWMLLAKFAERSLGLVSMLILARVLVPQDFGIVAMAMSFVVLLELLGAFGFETALIQRQTKERGHWDTAWTFNVVIGFGVAILMIALAAPIARFFKEPALVDVLRVLAIGSAAQGLQNIGLVAFRTEMQFDREFRFLTAKKLIGFVVTIPLALILESYWALVIGQTVGHAASTGLSYWVHPYRPRLTLRAAGDLLQFSKWMFVLNLIQYVKDRSANWVIGRIAGPTPLGAFTIAYEVATLPSTELVAPINRAVFPAYARLAKEGVEVLRREYLSVIAMIVLLATPAVFGVAATSPVLVPVMLGPNWAQAIPLLTLLALFGYTYVIQSNAQAAYLALGRVDIPAKVNGAHALIQLIALIPLTNLYGVIGSAFAYLITAAVMIPASLGVVLRMLNIRVLEFMAQVWRPLVAALVMYAGVYRYLMDAPAPTSSLAALPTLLAAVILGAAIYIGLLAGLWFVCGRPEGAEKTAVTRAYAVVARRFLRRGQEAA
jgi:O-antigen/teichoic acid export membrane protein